MADIVLHGVTPSAGDVLSVPVAIQYGLSQGGLSVGAPTSASCPAWDEPGDQSPIAEGSRAHIFVAPSWYVVQTGLGPMTSPGDWQLQILDTISAIKNDGKPLSDFAQKLGNAYCYDYSNPYTRGCAVSLTDKDYSELKTRFSFTRVGLSSGRVDASDYTGSYTHAWYYKSAAALSLGDWVQDGVDKSSMYEGYSKDISTGDVYRYDINNQKSALDPADVETHTVSCYRGLFFANDPYNAGELAAGDIIVTVDWDDTMDYTCYDGDDEHGNPKTKLVPGPKAIFSIAWDTEYGHATQRLTVTSDGDYEYSHMLDLYPQAAAEEFNFIELGGGGGGGGGNKGHGGRAVASSIPMRITSRGDVDYRHFLDLYDETNYNERNMFLTNFVGRIPYRYIEYNSSESGGTGIIRVQTNLQFTHFVGASFTDDNVPRVYEVLSHQSMGGNPEILLCTFKVCHLKDYFQHFGVTSENEFLVERSTNGALYNPFLRDPRMFSDDYVSESWDYGSGGFNGATDVLITLTDGRAVLMPRESAYPGYSHTPVPQGPTGIETEFYEASSLQGIINCVDEVDSNPDSELYTVSMINAVLSKIKGVYLVSSQMFAGLGYTEHVQVWFNMSYFTDASDRKNSLVEKLGIFEFFGKVISNPTVPISYTTGFLGPGQFNDWTDLEANYRLLIPWYGVAEVSGTELKRYIDQGQGTISVTYFISPLDGTITINLDRNARITNQWKNLPKLPVPSSCKTLAYRQTAEQIVRQSEIQDKQQWVQAIGGVGAGAVGAIVGAVTGNPLAAVGSLAAGAVAGVGTAFSMDLRHKSEAIGSEIAASNITFNSTSCDGFEVLAINVMKVVKVKKAEILNVYSVIGYPCRALWRSVGAVNGLKYWVSILGNIKGTSSYAQAVRGEIERDGIIYNFS